MKVTDIVPVQMALRILTDEDKWTRFSRGTINSACDAILMGVLPVPPWLWWLTPLIRFVAGSMGSKPDTATDRAIVRATDQPGDVDQGKVVAAIVAKGA